MKIIGRQPEIDGFIVEVSKQEWRALTALEAACSGAEDPEQALMQWDSDFPLATRGDIHHWIDAVRIFFFSLMSVNRAVGMLGEVKSRMMARLEESHPETQSPLINDVRNRN